MFRIRTLSVLRTLSVQTLLAGPFALLGVGTLGAGAARAQEAAPASSVPLYAPHDWQIWHQAPGSDLMANIEWFSAYTLWGMAVPVSLFVLALIAWVAYRYRQSANPVPDKVTHNTLVEIVWTVVPVIILVAIAIPSFQLLSEYERPAEKPTMTVKAIGYQWYWGYEYQDGEEGNELAFEQRPIALDVLANDYDRDGTFTRADITAERVAYGKEDPRLYPDKLVVDNEMVVPVGATVRMLVTAADVIHDWAMPAVGAKMDAIPGRLNEFTFTPKREGIYYGQCSELCGRLHAYMPIGMRVVSPELYAEWRRLAQTDIAAASKYIAEAQEAQAIARANAREEETIARARARETKKLAAVETAKPVN